MGQWSPEAYYKSFNNLFSTTPSNWEEVIDCIPNTITLNQNEELLKPVTDIEVKNALFQMHPDKSPDPDGMTPAFFQKHWSILGTDIVLMVRKFFEDGSIGNGLNDTNVVLIPKNKHPTKIGELRPISLCNVLIKVITEVLSN